MTPSRLLDGKAIAARLKASLRPRVQAVAKRLGRPPKLVFVVCIPADATEAYFAQELKACAETGVDAVEQRQDAAGGEAALEAVLRHLSKDLAVDAVLLASPLPKGFDSRIVLAALAPEKDVEGLTPLNQGLLYGAKLWPELERTGAFVPCTALALLRLLKASGMRPEGRHAVVIGRSSVVGRPAAHLLSCLDATVTLCHSRTRDLAKLAARADILVACVGRPGIVTAKMVKKGAVVLDAGTTWKGGRFVGDVDPAAGKRARWFTPVPGGVGPVTTAELLNAVVTAAERTALSPSSGLRPPSPKGRRNS